MKRIHTLGLALLVALTLSGLGARQSGCASR